MRVFIIQNESDYVEIVALDEPKAIEICQQKNADGGGYSYRAVEMVKTDTIEINTIDRTPI